MKALVNLSLPECAFLDDEALRGRNVILHVRSASVVEILEDNPALMLKDDVLSVKFTYHGIFGDERKVAVLHHAPLLLDMTNKELTEVVIRPCIAYYIEDCKRIDSEVTESDSRLN